MARVSVTEAETMMRNDLRAMKREYTQMRDIAQKRIKRMSESEFASSKTYLSHQKGFAKIKELDMKDFAKAFSELSKFVNAKGSTVTGQKHIRYKTIRTWQQQGLNLNKQNYNRTMQIMDEMRKRKILYGSDKAIQMSEFLMEANLSDSEFNRLLDHTEAVIQNLPKLQVMSNLDGISFDDLMNAIKE